MDSQIISLVINYLKEGIKGKLSPAAYGAAALAILLLSVMLYHGLNEDVPDVTNTGSANETAINSITNSAEEAERAVNAVLDFSVNDQVETITDDISTDINRRASDDSPFLE